MSEDKQCLQRDITEVYVSRRGAGRTCLMFVVKSRRMMSTLQWSRPRNECRRGLHVVTRQPLLHGVCYAEVLFQPSFYSGRAHDCLQNVRHQTRWLWYGMERSTTWITERDTAQTETERILTRLVTAHSWIAVCIKSKRVFAHVIHVLTLSHPVLSSRVAHTTRRSLSTRSSRMVAELSGCSKLIHGSMTVPTEYHATTMRIRWNLAD